ncbi:MAG: chemotaxis protein CheA [Vallitaleaceae bacterium]|nr:chemotaxis protein CheA [Vallitaleaceae bacterium]
MSYDMEPMIDLFVFETEQLLSKLEDLTMNAEEAEGFDDNSIQEIFRAMHTIKGSAAMMMLDQISTVSHVLEDLFDLMRNNQVEVDTKTVANFVFEMVDFVRIALLQVKEEPENQESSQNLKERIRIYVDKITGKLADEDPSDIPETIAAPQYYIPSLSANDSTFSYRIKILFSEDASMENIRGYTLMNAVKAFAIRIESKPDRLLEDDACIDEIQKHGFWMYLESNEEKSVIIDYLTGYPYVGSFEVWEESEFSKDKNIDLMITLEEDKIAVPMESEIATEGKSEIKENKKSLSPQGTEKNISDKMISVSVEKLDILMDLVGELVVSESMVSRNEAFNPLQNDLLEKAIRQHRKIINDVQDVAMSIRMVPLSAVFQKMKRLVRDIASKLDKEVNLILIGETTEVDKNIIESISDPLMHLIRNSLDHGIEDVEQRKKAGKSAMGTIVLEAKNSGGDVLILVKDDGKGLDVDAIYKKALDKGLITPEDSKPTDQELYSYIFKAGFSTKEEVSEYSGRGVGMDVAIRNIEKVGGSISVRSASGIGSTFVIKIPLTLSIIDGMRIRVANRTFILPITAIQQAFKVTKNQYLKDPSGNEMILYREKAQHLIRLHELYKIPGALERIHEGIIIMIGNDDKQKALFADELLGEQQVVVKPLSKYMRKIQGISGCAILGDGGISLILDLEELLKIEAR